jgi:hypothetical protein
VSGSGALLAHQMSQIAPKTGIFSTTNKKKMGQNSSTALSVEMPSFMRITFTGYFPAFVMRVS